jgi:UDP-GlcNAc:undecaprenyl-phosphate/decaprenyl-phosphate GlcNAc-1-phosphate transferase
MPNIQPSPFISFIVAYGLLFWIDSRPNANLPLDRPNARSLHSTPVPRIGGIGLLAGVAISLIVLDFPVSPRIAACALLLACVSLGDDCFGVSVICRLTAHLSAAGLVAFDLLFVDYGVLITLIAALIVTWGTNLYNFMDGSDGLAGGMAMFGFSFYAIAAFASGNVAFGWVNASIATAAAAFLVFNFHPARIFMGDVGSVPLGFLAGSLGLVGWSQNDWTWWFPILVFSPFIVDASVTLAKRAYSRAAIWQAHRDHYYQRLVQMGWGHRRTALAEYGVMLLCGTAAISGLRWRPPIQFALLIVVALMYAAIIASIEIAWRNSRKGQLNDC